MYFVTTITALTRVEDKTPMTALQILSMVDHAIGTSIKFEIKDGNGNLVTTEQLRNEAKPTKP